METDVLIIGAGGAGLRAAIESRSHKAETIIVCKGNFPSGCTPHAMGAIQAPYHTKDSPEWHFRDTVCGGRFVNDQLLVWKMVNESRKAVKDLQHFGTVFLKEKGKYKLFPFSGCTYPRALITDEPYAGGFIKGLVKSVQNLGIEIKEHIMVTRLLTAGRQVIGAVGVNSKNGGILAFNAKATVLATGGAGCLYSLTSNPEDVTGDGYALAYDAGAELVDMEFVQARACIVFPQRLRGRPPPADGLVTVGGRFFNGSGERYMKKHDPEKIDKVTRDLMGIYAHKEIVEGRGTIHGGVYNDLSDVPKNEMSRFQSFLQECKKSGVDPTWQPIEWAPGAHHFMGGVKINQETETTVPRLFACGEVTGGIHGANRLAANALTETLVFGAVAGRNASEIAHHSPMPKKTARNQIEVEQKRILSYLEREDGEDFSEIRAKIQDVMYKYTGFVRNEAFLQKAIFELDALSKRTLNLYISGEKNWDQLRRLLETKNLIEVGKMVSRAALMRRESRGSHYREDFPAEDNHSWLKNIVIKRQNGQMTLERRSPNMTYIKPN